MFNSPSFLIISVTIEKNPAPFATATISSASFLTCRVSQFADDLTADSSISRRSSLQRRQSKTRSALTMPTEAMFRLGASKDEKTASAPKQRKSSTSEKMANLPMAETNHNIPRVNLTPSSPIPPIPRIPDPMPTPTQAVPQPTYYPGGWRAEWNNVAQDVGAPQISEHSTDGSSSNNPSSSPYHGPQDRSASSSVVLPSSQTSQLPTAPMNSATANIPTQQHRYSHRMSGSTAPSNLSTVRYASEPEIAVQQSIKVMRNPAYQPRSISAGMGEYKGVEKPVISRPDVALLRNAQRAQKTGAEIQGPRRQPSNFSRPMQKPESQGETDSKANSGGDVKVPGAFVEDENV
ncbi:hypothetical protein E0Z10_g5271 [Xylaria hypoxylon]|uniref:Uncharacterized protein n=1 Tax=Xylaria hypoxylon TaxID=37992 RepID=A0A4Z0Z4A8_9PEZI|nr:hypothetical protein E0Z10_g5271 [Xylaria hypoxylon]